MAFPPGASKGAIATYLATATLAAGTITTSQPMTLTQTWNAAGVTFRGKENVFTITAAAVGSTVERWLGGAAGTTVLGSLSSIGAMALAAGSRLLPAFTFVGATDIGMWLDAGVTIRLSGGNTDWASFTGTSAEVVASFRINPGVAIGAGGTAGRGYMMSSATNFGIFYGSGAPTLAAAKGSFYMRSDGSTTNDRGYINTDGSTTWTALTTAG